MSTTGTDAIHITIPVRVNRDQVIETEAGKFYVEQRNQGFVDNDGHWIVTQLPELYWTSYGTLRQRRPSKHLGVFATQGEMVGAIHAAQIQPVDDIPLN